MAAATIYSTTTFSFLIFFLSLIKSETCQVSHCGHQNNLQIKFPFCEHPDFQIISCNNTRNQTLMSLPFSGQFIVKSIDYQTRTFLINDPENCMPKWLISNFTVDRPFRVEYDQQSLFSFINCTTDVTKNMSRVFLSHNVISCLSGDGYDVFAVRLGEAAAPCKVVSTVVVPAQEQRGYGLGLFEDVKVAWDDLSLDCNDCEFEGGTCFGSDLDNDFECRFLPPPSPPVSADTCPDEINYTPLVGVIVPVLLLTVLFICISCQRLQMSDTTTMPQHNLNTELSTSVATQQVIVPTSIAPNSTVSNKGLSRTTIQSYPKTKISESEKLPNPSDENTCSICLSEYQIGETIRTIPNCKHFFHVSCIDQWLLRNSSCPLCRDSSVIVPPDCTVQLPYSSMVHSP